MTIVNVFVGSLRRFVRALSIARVAGANNVGGGLVSGRATGKRNSSGEKRQRDIFVHSGGIMAARCIVFAITKRRYLLTLLAAIIHSAPCRLFGPLQTPRPIYTIFLLAQRAGRPPSLLVPSPAIHPAFWWYRACLLRGPFYLRPAHALPHYGA